MAVDHEPSEPEIGPLRDTSLVWRLSVWGGATTVALAAAILLTQTDAGSKRLQMAFSGASSGKVTQADFAPPTPAIVEAERREVAGLQAQIRDLTADRERLNARVAGLEQNLSDVTGSIKRELAIVAATAPSASPASPATPPKQVAAADTAAVAVAAADPKPESKQVSKPESKPDSKSETKVEAKLETAPPAPAAQTPSPHATPAESRETPVATRQDSKPPPREPAAAPLARLPMMPISPAKASSTTAAPVPRTGKEIAIDLGGAHSMEILLARWLAVKANFGPLLNGMSPLAVRDQRHGAIPFRLIVGPLANGAAAAQVCARFAASHVTCRATKFEGEQLAQQ